MLHLCVRNCKKVYRDACWGAPLALMSYIWSNVCKMQPIGNCSGKFLGARISSKAINFTFLIDRISLLLII